jgi:putative oxidoreductase
MVNAKEAIVKPILGRFTEYTYALLRIIAGLMFTIHGTMNLFGWPPSDMKAPLASIGGIAGLMSLVFGALVLIGLFTSLAAFLASGQMAVAYFMVHAPQGFFPQLNKGELSVLYCFIFLYVAARGAGIWSIDNAMARGRTVTATA